MKRYWGIIIILCLILGCTACSGENAPGGGSTSALTEAEAASEAQAESTSAAGETETGAEEQTKESTASEKEEPDWDAITFQPVEYILADWSKGEPQYCYFGPEGESVQVPGSPVKDVFTGEVHYYTVFCYEVSALGWKEGDKIYQLLFDPQGNLLEKRFTGDAMGAVGDLLIRNNYYGNGSKSGCGLWDPERGEYTVDNISELIRLDDDTAMVISGDGNIRGTLNRETLEVTEVTFERPLLYQWMEKGMIIAMEAQPDGEPVMVVLDDRLQPVYRSGIEGYCGENSIFDCGADGTFFCVNDLDGGRIVRYKDGAAEVICENEQAAVSGMFLISCSAGRMVNEERGECFLYDFEGNRLTESYEVMGPLQPDESGAARFGAAKQRTVYILNEDGEILGQKEIPDLLEVSFPGGAICCFTRIPKEDKKAADSGSEHVARLMDGSFCDIIPAVPDGQIDVRRIGNGPDYYWAVTRSGRGGWQYDLYNASFEPICKGASLVGTATDRGVAIRKGFSRGVIDYQGNWIAEHSIYEDEWRD